MNTDTQQPTLWATVQKFLRPIASLQLTCVLFVLAMILVFFGTLAQMNDGIWTVVDQYFWSLIVWIPFDLLAKFGQVFFFVPTDVTLPGSFPFPAGKLLGFVMLVNLLAAHAVRFKFTWKRSGIFTIHAGMILLFLGEAITRTAQVEQRMTIREGEVVHFTEDSKTHEVAIEFTDTDGTDAVTVIPQTRFVVGQRLSDPQLPFDLEMIDYMANSAPMNVNNQENPATTGVGLRLFAERRRPVSGTDQEQKVDMPSGYVKVYQKGSDKLLGVHLVSVWQSALGMPSDPIAVDGKTYQLSLRNTRYYKPYSIQLTNFVFTQYTGTKKAKGYQSDIRLMDPSLNIDRTHSISMNEPLRYAGEAFFQSGFDNRNGNQTVLQVVRNPGWLIPYISCVMVGLGMAIHFGMYLVAFLRRQQLPKLAAAKWQQPPSDTTDRLIRIGVIAFVALYLGSLPGRMFPKSEPYDLKTFSRIPVLDGGRWKPLDSFARVSYRMLAAREEVTYLQDYHANEFSFFIQKYPAIEWYLNLASHGEPTPEGRAAEAMCIKIDNDQVLALLKLKPRTGLLYSINEMADGMPAFLAAYRKVQQRQEKKETLDLYENKLLQVAERLHLYEQIARHQVPLVLPVEGQTNEWQSLDSLERETMLKSRSTVLERMKVNMAQLKGMPEAQQREIVDALVAEQERLAGQNANWKFWHTAFRLYREKKPEEFNTHIREYVANHPEVEPGLKRKLAIESWYNAFAPFYQCLMLYVIAALMCIFSWFGRTETWRRSAFQVLLLTVVIHFTALIVRMYLQDRWLVFVTNLYSSAVFIGFGCVVLGLLLERIYPIGMGNLCAAVLGVGTTIVSHQIAGGNDTMEMLVAVLDTNFWLATHVTCVTFGYTATFVAGMIAIMYVIRGIFTRSIDNETNKIFNNMLYGVVAFATLLSFVGTVLGGIWADQSWGRFWGWDPKENGAVLIVIWNCLILHARWAGLVKTRGMALLAIAGNMVTVWSWFGTNQLGIGLHAYGFDNTLAMVCTCLWVSHTGLIALGCLPQEHWLSFMPKEETRTAATPTARGKTAGRR